METVPAEKHIGLAGSTRAGLWPYLLLSLAFCLVVIPTVLRSGLGIYDETDEANFHYPTVLGFMDQFPNLDLVNYRSATTPLYHVILATAGLIIGPGLTQLRLLSSLISLACLLCVYSALARRGDRLMAFLIAMLLLLSPYFIGPASRLSTDNTALFFAIVSFLLMEADVSNMGRSILANVCILAAILTRQVYVWLVGAYLLVSVQKRLPGQSLRSWVGQIGPAGIPLLGLAFFVWLWHGLTPPGFARHSGGGLNLDVPVFAISLIGLYGSFFAPWLLQPHRRRLRPLVWGAGLAVGAAYLLLHPVSNEYDESRGGALWLVASNLPNGLGSSVVFWALFPLGLCYLLLISRELVSQHRYLPLVCFALWLAANLINVRTYQKYYEPFSLFFIGYSVMTVKVERWYYWIGPGLLLLGFAAVALQRFFF